MKRGCAATLITGRNKSMPQSEWPLIPPERGDDLHNLEAAEIADLVLFMAGNQFMAMADIVAAFREVHPEIGPNLLRNAAARYGAQADPCRRGGVPGPLAAGDTGHLLRGQ
jgi:hypothetical protein